MFGLVAEQGEKIRTLGIIAPGGGSHGVTVPEHGCVASDFSPYREVSGHETRRCIADRPAGGESGSNRAHDVAADGVSCQFWVFYVGFREYYVDYRNVGTCGRGQNGRRGMRWLHGRR